MSREIKFRAWDKEKQGWVCGSPLSLCVWLKSDANKWLGNDIFLKNIDFQQFTGLFDKNGTEIYEGDIVKYTGSMSVRTIDEADHPIQEIFWGNGLSGWKHPAGISGSWEVIGNLYENPELLKESEP